MNEGLFDYPYVLLALFAVIPLVWIAFGRGRQRSGPLVYSQTEPIPKLSYTPRILAARTLPILRILAFILIVFACARPTLKEIEESEVEGIDIYVALDLSGSMQSVDISDGDLEALQRRNMEPANRFKTARSVLQEFVLGRTVDRIGMVVFARDAFLQFPLTLDYTTILTQLQTLELGDIDGSGTAIGNAIGRAVAGLKDSDARTRIIILITDGDRRGGNISPKQAAQFARDLDIKVFPILVGKEGTTRVPVSRSLMTGRLNYETREYPVNPQLLEEIAQMTGGAFTRASDKQALRKNLQDILNTFETSRIQDISNVSRTELFPILTLLAVLLLALESLLKHLYVRPFP